MSISGIVAVDFHTEEFEVMLVPKAKQPEFFNLAVPIKLEGKFYDFGIGIGLARISGAIFSFITRPIHVPVRRVFSEAAPEDGQEACKQAWLISREEDSP